MVKQGDRLLWEGQGRGASTRTEDGGDGKLILVITVDGTVVARIPEAE